jgi:hypothetical protein
VPTRERRILLRRTTSKEVIMTVGPHRKRRGIAAGCAELMHPVNEPPRQRDDQQRAWPDESLVSGSHRAGT